MYSACSVPASPPRDAIASAALRLRSPSPRASPEMAGFSASSFKSKLEKLSESQQSIQTLSHWVQYHKKSVKESAAIWAKEVLRGKPERRLLYVYLANDIMQNSRRKGNTFIEEFGKQLPTVMPDTFAACPEHTREKLLRLLSIWEERRVVPSSLIAELRASMNAAAARGGGGGGTAAEGEYVPEAADAHQLEDAAPAAAPAGGAAAALGVPAGHGGGGGPTGGVSPRAAAAAAAARSVGQVTLAQLLTNLEEG